MNGIEKITDKIISDAEAYSDEVRKNAEAHAERMINDARARANEAYNEAILKSAAECADIKNRAVSSAYILERNILLDAKIKLAEKAFERALEALTELKPELYAEFLIRKLKEAADMSEIEENHDDPYIVALCDKDLKKYKGRLEEELSPIAAAKKRKLRFSESGVEMTGGLILKRGKTEINASFESLLGNLKKSMTDKVCGALFDDIGGNGVE